MYSNPSINDAAAKKYFLASVKENCLITVLNRRLSVPNVLRTNSVQFCRSDVKRLKGPFRRSAVRGHARDVNGP